MTGQRFLKTAFKDPSVGALTASSQFVVRRIAKEITHDIYYVVEYGAGNGVITKGILRALPRDGRLVAIERNRELLKELEQIHDPRLRIFEGDVVSLSKTLTRLPLPRIDAVISGIPFSFLQPRIREIVVRRTHRALGAGGIFLLYQHSPLMMQLLKKMFRKVRIRFEPRNFLPYFIMKAIK